jgi:acyl CoA:acetate/3-ketoacid CoA transferase beta subunit
VKVWIQSENGILGMVSFAKSLPQAGLTINLNPG